MSRTLRYGVLGVVLLAGVLLVTVDLGHPYDMWLQAVLVMAPLTLVVAFLLARQADERLGVALAALGTGGPGDTLRNALRRTLADPDLEIVYTRVGRGGWISELGEETATPGQVTARAFTPIDRGGKPVAGLVHDPVLLRHPQRLRAAIEAASLALDNERLKAHLRAELLESQASRARIVDAGDRELKRVERDLHDGAQQRLVGLALMLRLASRRAAGDPEVTVLLDDAARELEDALAELRDLTRAIHPAIVDDAGLRGALESLSERPGVAVELHVDFDERLPDAVEVAAYYVVAEALTNVNKHANATKATVRAAIVDEVLRVSVSDAGTGERRPLRAQVSKGCPTGSALSPGGWTSRVQPGVARPSPRRSRWSRSPPSTERSAGSPPCAGWCTRTGRCLPRPATRSPMRTISLPPRRSCWRRGETPGSPTASVNGWSDIRRQRVARTG